MMLLDIHTHCLSTVPGESILNVEPAFFDDAEWMDGRYYSVGIHPWKVSAAGEPEWERLQEVVKHPAVLAIGETGLDKLYPDIERQQEWFTRHISLSESVRKPLLIHCVKAFNELIELKKKYRPQMPWIVHGFRNNRNVARQLMEANIYFSFGEKYQLEVLQLVPLERLLAETDESLGGIHAIIGRMAKDRGMEVGVLRERLYENVRNIFFHR